MASGKDKGQSASVSKHAPAKDGVGVVNLAEPVLGGSAFFNVTSSKNGKGGFGLGVGPDKQFTYIVPITNRATCRVELSGMINEAQTNLLALVKR